MNTRLVFIISENDCWRPVLTTQEECAMVNYEYDCPAMLESIIPAYEKRFEQEKVQVIMMCLADVENESIVDVYAVHDVDFVNGVRKEYFRNEGLKFLIARNELIQHDIIPSKRLIFVVDKMFVWKHGKQVNRAEVEGILEEKDSPRLDMFATNYLGVNIVNANSVFIDIVGHKDGKEVYHDITTDIEVY